MRRRTVVLSIVVVVVAMLTIAGMRMPNKIPAEAQYQMITPQPTPPVGPLSWEITLWSGGYAVRAWYTDDMPVYEDGMWSFVDVVMGQPVCVTGTVTVTY